MNLQIPLDHEILVLPSPSYLLEYCTIVASNHDLFLNYAVNKKKIQLKNSLICFCLIEKTT